MQIQAEPGRPPGDLVLPPQDVEPVLHELLSPLWINFEKSCKKAKSFLFGYWLGELIMADLKIHSKGDFQQDLTLKSAWLLLYMLMCTPLVLTCFRHNCVSIYCPSKTGHPCPVPSAKHNAYRPLTGTPFPARSRAA